MLVLNVSLFRFEASSLNLNFEAAGIVKFKDFTEEFNRFSNKTETPKSISVCDLLGVLRVLKANGTLNTIRHLRIR